MRRGMKKYYLLLLGVVAAIFYGCHAPKKGQKQVAIITPVSHPSFQSMEKAVMETMEEHSPGKYRFSIYNSQGNKILMRTEIEEVAGKSFDLVVTLGAAASKMTKEIFYKRGIATPIVFTAAPSPEKFHIIDSQALYVTGVKEEVPLQREIECLVQAKPEIQRLLLVYNPESPALVENRGQLEVLLQALNIRLIVVEVFQASEIQRKVTPFISQVDAVLVLKDNTVVSGLDALVKLCNLYKVPLMASDLDSPDRGAALAYGVYEKEFGIEAAKQALQILEAGIPPRDIPVTTPSHFILRLNEEAAKKQGLKLEKLKSIACEVCYVGSS
ncbi:MAG: hypothetical protein FJZ63_00695 [Chlamydiae bacterium]|nr:hypothetical protein [Chlamydiota bacterium]